MLSERLDAIRRTRQSNCLGTVLYLAGKQKKDTYIALYDRTVGGYLERDVLETPEQNCAVLFVDEEMTRGLRIRHIGIVTNPKKREMVHRVNTREPLIEGEDIHKVAKARLLSVQYRRFKK